MDLERIEAVLAQSLRLRAPAFGMPQRERVEAMQEFMLTAAITNGDLREARFYLQRLHASLQASWDAMQGWEQALRVSRTKATKQDIQAAKITTEPQLHEQARRVAELLDGVDDQIERIEQDERAVSRAYSMLTGS